MELESARLCAPHMPCLMRIIPSLVCGRAIESTAGRGGVAACGTLCTRPCTVRTPCTYYTSAQCQRASALKESALPPIHTHPDQTPLTTTHSLPLHCPTGGSSWIDANREQHQMEIPLSLSLLLQFRPTRKRYQSLEREIRGERLKYTDYLES